MREKSSKEQDKSSHTERSIVVRRNVKMFLERAFNILLDLATIQRFEHVQRDIPHLFHILRQITAMQAREDYLDQIDEGLRQILPNYCTSLGSQVTEFGQFESQPTGQQSTGEQPLAQQPTEQQPVGQRRVYQGRQSLGRVRQTRRRSTRGRGSDTKRRKHN